MTSPLRLMIPFPTMMIPPQSPGARWPGTLDEVKTMGAAAVPCASIFEPRRIQSEVPAVPDGRPVMVAGELV